MSRAAILQDVGFASLARERWDANIPHCDRRESQSPEEGVQACVREEHRARTMRPLPQVPTLAPHGSGPA